MAKCYSEENVAHLSEGLANVRPKLLTLQLALLGLKLNVPAAKEYADHGVARRLFTLARCIEKIFETLPPNLEGIPDNDAVKDATIFLQAFIANTFGALDNLAHVWAKEMDIRGKNSEPLSNSHIGLTKKCKLLRSTFSTEIQAYLSSSQNELWFANLVDYRDALAHRIPLYIPPNCIAPSDDFRCREIDSEIWNLRLVSDVVAITRLEKERKKVLRFVPDYIHSLFEGAESRNIHGQILSDFLTVEEIVYMFIHALNARTPAT